MKFEKLLLLITISLLPVLAEAKVVLITGASGDIGLGITEFFLKKGEQVICQYNSNSAKLKALDQKFPKQMRLISTDFTKPNTIKDFWKAAITDQQIDIVVNCSGIEKEDVSLEQIQDTINVNYLSSKLICDNAIEHFKQKSIKGIIINLGSRAAYRGHVKGYYTYADSKAALHKYSHQIARDNAVYGITVYVIAPGPVEGKMLDGTGEKVKQQVINSLPTKQVVKVSEIVAMVELLASGQVPNATGGVFDLMGASISH
jgi:3-oxoacyl-[acyl-carrier protein] reductase